MDELVRIRDTDALDGQTQGVSARELHKALESKQAYTNWFHNRKRSGGFREGVHYVSLIEVLSKGRGGKNRRNHLVSLNMAKHLCLMEHTEKGHQVRDYFIEIEKRYWEEQEKQAPVPVSPPPAPVPTTMAQLLLAQAQALVDLEQRQLTQEQRQTAIDQRQADLARDQELLEMKQDALEERVDSAVPKPGYFTLTAYCRHHKIPPKSRREAALAGQVLARECRRLELEVAKVDDARFGFVNSYPESILQWYFGR